MKKKTDNHKSGGFKKSDPNKGKPSPFKKNRSFKPLRDIEGDEDPERDDVTDVSSKQELFKEGDIRLNRYIANSGLCSRRDADAVIAKGLVSVNGVTVTEMGCKVRMHDKVMVEGKIVLPEKKVYIVMNKPKGVVTTMDDPEGRDTVMDLIGDGCEERVYPVGRLDKNTTGVLLLTNDGELTKKLTHPKYQQRKIYHVRLDKDLTKTDMMRIAEGLELEDGFIAADALSYVGLTKDEVGIEIHSGRNRLVRRIFEHLGYQVLKLDRTYFAGLTKKNLPRGKWRHLDKKEVFRLKMNIFN